MVVRVGIFFLYRREFECECVCYQQKMWKYLQLYVYLAVEYDRIYTCLILWYAHVNVFGIFCSFHSFFFIHMSLFTNIFAAMYSVFGGIIVLDINFLPSRATWRKILKYVVVCHSRNKYIYTRLWPNGIERKRRHITDDVFARSLFYAFFFYYYLFIKLI